MLNFNKWVKAAKTKNTIILLQKFFAGKENENNPDLINYTKLKHENHQRLNEDYQQFKKNIVINHVTKLNNNFHGKPSQPSNKGFDDYKHKLILKNFESYLTVQKFSNKFDHEACTAILHEMALFSHPKIFLENGDLLKLLENVLNELVSVTNPNLFFNYFVAFILLDPPIAEWKNFFFFWISKHENKMHANDALRFLALIENENSFTELFYKFEAKFLEFLKHSELNQVNFCISLLRLYVKTKKLDENFINTIELYVVKNLDSSPAFLITTLAVFYHYDENIPLAHKLHMLLQTSKIIEKRLDMFSLKECISFLVIYSSYDAQYSFLIDKLLNYVIREIEYANIEQIDRLLMSINTIKNLSSTTAQQIVKTCENKLFSLRNLNLHNLVSIVLTMAELGCASQDFFKFATSALINGVHQMDIELLSKAFHSISISYPHEYFGKKIIERLYSLMASEKIAWKYFFLIIRTFDPTKDFVVEFFTNFQRWLIEKKILQKWALNDVAMFLWSVADRFSIKEELIQDIYNVIMDLQIPEDYNPWDIYLILWGSSKFNAIKLEQLSFIYKKFELIFFDIIHQLEIEHLISLTFHLSEIIKFGKMEENVFEELLKRFRTDQMLMNEEQLSIVIVVLTSSLPENIKKENADALIQELYSRLVIVRSAMVSSHY